MKHFLRHHRLAVLLFFLPWGMYFLFLWSHALISENGNLLAGHPYIWADWSMHIALAANFAFRPVSHWFDSLPVYSRAAVTYPFVTNLVSGLLWKSGLSLPLSFILPSVLCTAAALVSLYFFFWSIAKNQLHAVIMATVFLCSGGLGVFFVVWEKGPLALLDSTEILTQISAHQIEVNSIIPSMLVPQRAFLLGLPVGIVVIWIILNQFVFGWKKKHPALLGIAGVLAGLLPIIHTHTFLMIVLFCFWIFLWKWRLIHSWLLFGIPAVCLSLITYFVFLRGSVSLSTFFSLNLGWIEKESLGEWVLFWIKNWGMFLPTAIVGTVILYVEQKRKTVLVILFFWFLFLLANIVQFQPQQWDNTKMFAWVYFGLSVPVGAAVASLFRLRYRALALGCGISVLLLLIFSGGVDVIHNLDRERKTFEMLSSDQIAIGEFARTNTDPTAVFLTRPIVSNPISMIGGRSVYLGYPGWAFSYGLDYSKRETEIKNVFSGQLSLEVLQTTETINYVYVEKSEKELDWIESDPHVKKIYENDAGAIYSL